MDPATVQVKQVKALMKAMPPLHIPDQDLLLPLHHQCTLRNHWH
jgi:hypothetical protein